MDERDWLAERFEEYSTRLRAVAYRMLGSLSEADDAVQGAWLRVSRTDASEIENRRLRPVVRVEGRRLGRGDGRWRIGRAAGVRQPRESTRVAPASAERQ